MIGRATKSLSSRCSVKTFAMPAATASRVLPVPGARTPQQASENAGALEFDPLPESVMAEIETILERPQEFVHGRSGDDVLEERKSYLRAREAS